MIRNSVFDLEREVTREAVGINQSFLKTIQKFRNIDPGITRRQALGVCEVFTSILAKGQGTVPDFLHPVADTISLLGKFR